MRTRQALRDALADVSLSRSNLVMPIFIKPGRDERRAVSSMPDVFQESPDAALRTVREQHERGVSHFLLFGVVPPETPSPLNLFMNIPWTAEGALSFDPPISAPGSYVCLKAQMDLIVAFSACPQDMLPVNGREQVVRDAHFQILD